MKIYSIQNQKLVISFLVGALICALIFNFKDRNKMKIDLVTQEQNDGVVVAKVNNEKIYSNQVNQKLSEISQKLVFNDLKKEEKELIVKEVFAQDLVLKNAIKNKSYEKYSPSLKRFAIEEAKNNYLEEQSRRQITQDLVKEKYQEIVKEVKGRKEYLVSYILTKDKTQIDKAFNSLNASSFEDVAKKFSIDSSNSQNGGKLGYIVAGTTMPEFDSQIQKLKVNQTSKPFKTNLGWHIIKVTDVRDVVPAKLEDVKGRIEDSLVAQNKKAVATKLIENAKIEIF